METLLRLDKFIAIACGVSRKKAQQLIQEGLVQVNGKVVKNSFNKINYQKDLVFLDNKPLNVKSLKVYYLFHKPPGVITSTKDRGKTVIDLLPEDLPLRQEIFPVGRLDKDTTGLLLLTNDGELAHRLTHPKWKIPKGYFCLLDNPLEEDIKAMIESGVDLSDGKTMPCEITFLSEDHRWLKIVVFEGRYHLIKRLFKRFGLKVLQLKRITFGPLELGNLKEGDFRELTEEEVELLKRSVNLKEA